MAARSQTIGYPAVATCQQDRCRESLKISRIRHRLFGLGYLRLAICICFIPAPARGQVVVGGNLLARLQSKGAVGLVIAAFADGPLLQQLLAPPHGPRLDAIG